MSKIEVNTIEPQCGTTLTVGKCTTSVAVPGNVVKSNALQASDGGNIVSQSGTTVTLGASGDSIALASGATQTGFGRTGTVDWNTTKITADPGNAVSGTGYFCDTSGAAFTVTLPTSPTAGDIVAVSDYTRTFNSKPLTIGRNSKPIGGVANDAVLSVDGQSATFVFVDDTEGWINIQETETSQTGQVPAYVVATGGTPCSGTTVGDYKIHSFTGPGTLTVSCAGNVSGNNKIDYYVVAGGGGGGGDDGGGGGAGGFRESVPSPAAWTASPLAFAGNARPVTATPYPIVVGAGGSGGPCLMGTAGADSSFDDITSAGGGAGLRGGPGTPCRGDGGSGGGADQVAATGGSSSPVTVPAQGTAGGNSNTPNAAGGGGGATVAGTPNPCATKTAGAGGAGATSEISNSPVIKAGGGGGGGQCAGGAGGPGGGGEGGDQPQPSNGNGVAGTVNTGGGGGGGATNSGPRVGGGGGSGIVIIRYKFQ